MPGNSKSPQAYLDIERDLDTMLRHDQWPVTIPCGTDNAAIRWIARANAFRVALREMEEAALQLKKGEGTCKYDILTFTREGATVIIKKLSRRVLLIGGEPVEAISDRELEQEWEKEIEQ